MRLKGLLLLLLSSLWIFGCAEDDQNEQIPVVPDPHGGEFAKPDFTADPRIIQIYENGPMAKTTLRLLAKPTQDVTIHATMADDSEFRLLTDKATLTPESWTSGFAFYIVPIDDGIADGTQFVDINFTIESADPLWNALAPVKVQVMCLDSGNIATPIDCTSNPDAPECKQTVDCTTNPDAPECKQTIDCTTNPDAPECKQTVDCTANPDAPECKQTVDCTANPDAPECKQTVDCTANPDAPECKVDCTKTPDAPECKVDCTKTPDAPECKVDCTKTPDAPECKVDCTKTPDAPECKVDCTKTPDAPECKVDCTKTPDAPECKVDCTKTPDAPECKVDCTKTPDAPECKVDCTKTPDAPECKVDCTKTPDAPECKQEVDCTKTPDAPECITDGIKIRFMAANITSGNHQNYDDGKGIRMFQAMKPDIVMIQEFNYKNDSASDFREMLDTAFGTEYHYYRGTGKIPNGVISRYPITATGTWDSSKTPDRDPEWAIVDIPGSRDLLVVSVHLSTKNNDSELSPLQDKIKSKQSSGNYYVVLGGDFNTRTRTSVRSKLGSSNGVFTVGEDGKSVCEGGQVPVDQNENSCTSAERDDPYDWVLMDKTLNKFEVPVVIGSHSYPHGHILDSRIYAEHNELNDIPPVKETDSWKCVTSATCSGKNETLNNFQHMPVIRDVVLPKP